MANNKKPRSIKDLTLDEKNANQHSEYGTGLLENSLRELGFARSIVISDDNVVIAGNGTVESAAAIGLENVQVVETDGTKIIAVKRVDVKSGTAKFHQLALADNIVAQKNIVMDAKVVEALVEDYGGELDFWAGIVLEPAKQEEVTLPDADKANMVQVTFTLSGRQGAALQQAIKISKQLYKTKFSEQDNTNSNGNALFFIIDQFIQQNKHVNVTEDDISKQSETVTKAPEDTPPARNAFISREEGGKVRAGRKKSTAPKQGQRKR